MLDQDEAIKINLYHSEIKQSIQQLLKLLQIEMERKKRDIEFIKTTTFMFLQIDQRLTERVSEQNNKQTC